MPSWKSQWSVQHCKVNSWNAAVTYHDAASEPEIRMAMAAEMDAVSFILDVVRKDDGS